MSSAFLRHRHLNEDNQPPPRLAELQKHAEQSPTADAIPGEIITACDEYKYDTVIPIVYPNQPITIPFYAISDAMTAMQFAALSIPSSIEATFDRPNASPPLSILRQTASQARVLGIGHAGVVIINGETGQTRYYEYGRYGGPFGQVREVTVADVSLEDYCNPSSVSLHTLSRELTRTNGGPYAYEAAYIKYPTGLTNRWRLSRKVARLPLQHERPQPTISMIITVLPSRWKSRKPVVLTLMCLLQKTWKFYCERVSSAWPSMHPRISSSSFRRGKSKSCSGPIRRSALAVMVKCQATLPRQRDREHEREKRNKWNGRTSHARVSQSDLSL